jgi:1-acyl-sn-glycerol-3-phosphate acyltransferase
VSGRLLRSLLRRLFFALVRLYYPRRQVLGLEHLPVDGPRDTERVPVLFTANHPNGLLDPLVLALAVGRPVRFLAKSTFFKHAPGRLAMSWPPGGGWRCSRRARPIPIPSCDR